MLFLVRRAFLQTATTATLHALIEQREPVGEAGAPAALKILKSCEAEEMHATWKETERVGVRNASQSKTPPRG